MHLNNLLNLFNKIIVLYLFIKHNIPFVPFVRILAKNENIHDQFLKKRHLFITHLFIKI